MTQANAASDRHRMAVDADALLVPVSPRSRLSLTGLLGLGQPMAASAANSNAHGIGEESLVNLRRRFVEHMARSAAYGAVPGLPDEAGEAEEAEADAADDLRIESFDLRASTLPGALASLEWARDEFAQHYVDTRSCPDWMDRWTLAMLDSALGVLRQHAAEQAV